MSVPYVFSSGGIVLNAVGMASPVGWAGLTTETVELGNEVRTLRKFGSIYESQAAITSRSPTIAWATTQVKTALAAIGAAGRCIKFDGSHPGLDSYMLKHHECNYRDTSDSQRYRVQEGYIVPQTLSVSHREAASLSGLVVAVSKSGNEPVTGTPNVAMPTGLADTETFGLLTQTVAGINLTGIKSLSIDFGVQLTTESADGSIFPEWVSVGSLATRITLTGINPRILGTGAGFIPPSGVFATHANTTLRLVRYVETTGGSYQDLAGAHHITITTAGLVVVSTAASAGDQDSPATTSLMIYSLHDGANVPLVINTAAALA